MQLTNCPNCHAQLNESMFSAVRILHPDKINLINEYSDTKAYAYCNKCGNDPFNKYLGKYKEELMAIRNKLQKLIEYVPIVSTHSPYKWEYTALGLVTGQMVIGTGVLADISASFSEMLGMQSGSYNQKIKDGERMCSAQLRKQALDIGGNAIIATDVDYSELGGGRGLIMVCMSGTAVKVSNTEVLGENKIKHIDMLTTLNERELHLRSFNQ